jgi:UDP-2-acetamido-3-amino-2,3-dideoxy-glucuronate N-acetyltransferase
LKCDAAERSKTARSWRAEVASESQIHNTAHVEDGALIGTGTAVWHHAHVRSGSKVGKNCSLGFGVYVDTGVSISDRCKIQNHVSIFRGVTLEESVLVGPSAVFTNDLYPRSQNHDWQVVPTLVKRGASIGANATIVCGVEIGEWAMVGAGSVVTKDIAANALVVGNPARQVGWVCSCGNRLPIGDKSPKVCDRCQTSWILGQE